jgi:hypothetical protein
MTGFWPPLSLGSSVPTRCKEVEPMAKMTPEQEAAYALRWGIARGGLPPDAQLAYARLVEQQARAAASAPAPPADGEAASAHVTMPRWAAALGTAVFALIAQGAGVVLLPYAFTPTGSQACPSGPWWCGSSVWS